jgi:Tol biopolymer transport system component
MRADGSGRRQLTRLQAVSGAPAFAPGGTTIAFQSNLHGNHDEIYRIGIDGKGFQQQTRSSADTIDPAFSPDGMLSFSRDGSLWGNDGSGKEKQLTPGGGNDASPAWRPAPARTR